MKKKIVLFLSLLLLAACAPKAAAPIKPQMPELIQGEDYDTEAGADSYANAGDHEQSIYYTHPDFYNMKSTDTLTILPNFKTMQQTTEWSCGNAAALMSLYYLGITNYTEMQIAEIGGSHTDLDTAGAKPGSADNFYEYGTNVKQLYTFFSQVEGIQIKETSYKAEYTETDLVKDGDSFTPNDIGNLYPTFSSNVLYASENSDETESWVEDAKDSYFVKMIRENLQNNALMMVEWGDWDGHWTTIIGYDTMGTPEIGDDVIIFADSYDTSDHWQDGYRIYPAERFFYMWKDRSVAMKPYQLQPFITIALAK